MRKPEKSGKRADKQTSSSSSVTDLKADNTLPLSRAQAILNTFKNVFADTFDCDLGAHIQRLKGHLFKREFEQAFNNSELAAVYAVRWSAARALAYTEIFDEIFNSHSAKTNVSEPAIAETSWSVACIGGSAAELVAISHSSLATCADLSLNLLDRSTSLEEGLDGLRAQCYEQASDLKVRWFSGWDALQKDSIQSIREICSESQAPSRLITMMFTLNELYAVSLPQTTCLLNEMTTATPRGTLLLVADSPGSYSTVSLGNNARDKDLRRRYPMQWLLDHTLLEPEGMKAQANWERLISSDSTWFRIPPGLDYPISLENTHYQIHLYRRL